MTKVQKISKQSKLEMPFHEDEQKKISDVHSLLDDLFKFRLIDKISRPTTNKQRQMLIGEFKKKLNELHNKMQQIKSDSFKQSETHSNKREKSGKSTRATKPLNWKNELKNVASKYHEVLVEGSFKHYDKVSKIHGINIPMKTLDCHYWLESSLLMRGKQPQKCC